MSSRSRATKRGSHFSTKCSSLTCMLGFIPWGNVSGTAGGGRNAYIGWSTLPIVSRSQALTRKEFGSGSARLRNAKSAAWLRHEHIVDPVKLTEPVWKNSGTLAHVFSAAGAPPSVLTQPSSPPSFSDVKLKSPRFCRCVVEQEGTIAW